MCEIMCMCASVFGCVFARIYVCEWWKNNPLQDHDKRKHTKTVTTKLRQLHSIFNARVEEKIEFSKSFCRCVMKVLHVALSAKFPQNLTFLAMLSNNLLLLTVWYSDEYNDDRNNASELY